VSQPPFQAVLDAHAGDVYRFLVAAVGSNDADDCWQETFLAALRAYPRLKRMDNLRGWVFTIAHRKALDLHRRKSRGPVPVAVVPEVGGAESPDGDPVLWRAVRSLPPKQRGAILHRYVNDLPYKDVGELIGSTPAAARRSVHEGLKKLREEYGYG
jgi:DNA-directed RNA polymerase specialized sigma24 family protein